MNIEIFICDRNYLYKPKNTIYILKKLQETKI